ncbi:DUF6817 domain-containing protein [Streptomyces sp. NPDC096057]|uniref:DUF6817 domain-containing protein n=1 Tax=Streptomyces sp. NPDC096057 TaxID=3155543 RepID=UPI0033245F3B
MASAEQQHLTGEGRAAIDAFLRDRGADDMPHPGGTLLAHLGRVQGLLAEWGADAVVQTAGLCHATYGTDGFAPALLPLADRGRLIALIGERAEALVYLYASCDRGEVYPRVDGTATFAFRERFTGRDIHPPADQLRAFFDITAANELDVLAHNTELAARYGPGLHALLTRAGTLLSPAAREAVNRQLG